MPIMQIVARLTLAAVCSAAVGFEREAAQKAAGLRTHTLVGVGAATFTIVSIVGFEGADQSRVAAQIVTGIGFLGAGAIFREGAFVKGLTTAAGLWAVAALGLAAGAGSYPLVYIGTTVVLVVLYALRAADAAVARRTARARETIRIHLESSDHLSGVLKFARRIDEQIVQVDFKRLDDTRCTMVLAVDPDHTAMVAEMLAAHKGVERVERLNALYRPPGAAPPLSKKG
jgi:putative Mg2+ transporter-C (MgtC) family protein